MKILHLVFSVKAHVKIFYVIARHHILYRYIQMHRKEHVSEYVMEIFSYLKEHLPHVTAIEYNYMPRPGYGTYECGKKTPICWETPITLMVYLDGKIAFGIGLELKGEALSIRQLQGVKGFRFSKSSQDWARQAVLACRECLQFPEIAEVRLYRAHTSIAYEGAQIESSDPEELSKMIDEHKKRMQKRYDEIATQLQMNISPAYGSWT